MKPRRGSTRLEGTPKGSTKPVKRWSYLQAALWAYEAMLELKAQKRGVSDGS